MGSTVSRLLSCALGLLAVLASTAAAQDFGMKVIF
jgi:hypothetical protein